MPILFLSALTDKHKRLKGLRAGGVDYINKPFHVEETLERTRIHRVLSQRKTPITLKSTSIDHPRSDGIPLNPPPTNLMLKQVATEFILNHLHDPTLKNSDVVPNLQISTRHLNFVFESSDRISISI